MSRRKKIIILIVAGLLAIALIVYFIIWPTIPHNATPTNVNAGNQIKPISPAVNVNAPKTPSVKTVPPTEVLPATKQTSAARTVTLAFAERLATYTNQNNFSNFADLEAFGTPAVWKYINGEYRASLVKQMPPAASYYAVTASAINSSVSTVSANEVDAKVLLRRVETGAVKNTSYATLDLVLKKIDGNWLVARFDWEKP